RFCKTQVGLRSLPRSPYAGLGVRLWLLLVIIFFGFFEVKFRKKLKSDSNGCQGSLYQGDMKPSKHSGQRPYHPTCVTSVQMRVSTTVRPDTPHDGRYDAQFKTTRWSIVLSCADSGTDDAEAQAAL